MNEPSHGALHLSFLGGLPFTSLIRLLLGHTLEGLCVTETSVSLERQE